MLPGQHHTRTGIPSRVTAIPTTTCGRSSRESLDFPRLRNPAWPVAPAGGSPSSAGAAIGAVVGAVGVGLDDAGRARRARPARRGPRSRSRCEVVSKKIRSTSRLSRCATGVEHPARELVLHRDEPVHGPVAGVVGHRAPGRGCARRGPPSEVAASFEDGANARFATSANSTRSTTGSRRVPAARRRSRVSIPSRCHSPSSSHAPPSGRDSTNSRPGTPTTRARSGPAGDGLDAHHAGQRADQALDRGPVELIGAAEGVQHLRPGGLRGRVPLVVGQLQVGHLRPVPVPPGRRTHEHATRPYTTRCSSQHQTRPSRVTRAFAVLDQVAPR